MQNGNSTKTGGRERALSKINSVSEIVEVYMDNFYKELERIEALAQEFNFIGMVSITSVIKNFYYRTPNFLEMSSMEILK